MLAFIFHLGYGDVNGLCAVRPERKQEGRKTALRNACFATYQCLCIITILLLSCSSDMPINILS